MLLSSEFILSAFSGVTLVSALMFYITSTVPRICPGHYAWMMSAIAKALAMIFLLTFSLQDQPDIALLAFKVCTLGWAMGMYRGIMRFLYKPQNLQQLMLITALTLLLIGYFEHISPNPFYSDIIFSVYCSCLIFSLVIAVTKNKSTCCKRILKALALLLSVTGLHLLDFPFFRDHPTLANVGFLVALILTTGINILLISLAIHQLLNQLEASEAAALNSACHDPLTGLLNRSGLAKEFQQRATNLDIHEQSLILMFIDLDGFKKINDTYGHQAGDLVLKTIAKRLQSHTNNVKDMIARFGGDEFIILLQFNAATVTPHIQRQIANRLLKSINQPIAGDKEHYDVGGSIGISQYPHNAKNLDELLNQADQAMYQAKQSGANTFRFWTPNTAYTLKPLKHDTLQQSA